MKTRIETICLDMDGVLVNWSKGLCNLLQIDFYREDVVRQLATSMWINGPPIGTAEEIQEKVDNAGYDFWYNLELFPWAIDLFKLCQSLVGENQVFFLTSPAKFHAGAHAKLDYLWSKFNSDNYILTSKKFLCAAPNRLLIDDMLANIDLWEKYGGQPFLWPNQWDIKGREQEYFDKLKLLF